MEQDDGPISSRRAKRLIRRVMRKRGIRRIIIRLNALIGNIKRNPADPRSPDLGGLRLNLAMFRWILNDEDDPDSSRQGGGN
jgi:hypothetical protein